MKVSIIGTNGFLSTTVAIYCNEKGWELDMYGLKEPQNHSYNNFYKTNLLTDKLNYSIINQSDIIIYASGAGIQSNLNESGSLIYTLNVTIPINICNELKSSHYKGVFITFGSVFEMGKTSEKRLFKEDDILTSICEAPNDYTVSKRILSRFVEGYKHDFTHWHFYIPTIYGEMENPLRLIPYTINSIKDKKELKFTSGDQVRQYIYVKEIPLIIEKAFYCELPSGLYNIGGTETLSVKEIVTLIHKEMGEKVSNNCFGSAERKDAGMKYLALDGTKLYSAINYKPQIYISDIIKRY